MAIVQDDGRPTAALRELTCQGDKDKGLVRQEEMDVVVVSGGYVVCVGCVVAKWRGSSLDGSSATNVTFW